MKKLFFIGSSIVGLVAAALWYISPILKPFPQASGSYSIGTQALYFIDQNREDSYSSIPGKRAVMVRIWYPSSDRMGEKYPYLGSKMPFFQRAFAEKYNIPYWVSALLWRTITTNAYSNASLAISHASYPVILFSHGLLGLPIEMYSSIIENLATQGYIVVGIDHPYFNLITQYPDGTIISSDALSVQFQNMRPLDQSTFQSNAIDVYKADMKLVIDQLQLLNQDANSIFYRRLDLDHIGVMGHSAGGTAAIEFCRSDGRCKAIADLDGWYDHVIGNEPLEKPLLMLFGSESIETVEPTPEYLRRKELTREEYLQREQNIIDHKKALSSIATCSMVLIPGASHNDFSDAILLKWPLREWKAVDSYRTLDEINSRLVHFFNTYLLVAKDTMNGR